MSTRGGRAFVAELLASTFELSIASKLTPLPLALAAFLTLSLGMVEKSA